MKTTTARKARIAKVWTERKPDDCPDTSTLGEYTDSPSEWAICRCCGEYLANLRTDRECPHCGEGVDDDCTTCPDCGQPMQPYHEIPSRSREYRFFVPYAGGEDQGTDDYQHNGKLDYARAESMNRGDWYYIGIIAKAEIISANGTVQTIRSGGLWGVESDAGEYLTTVEDEELSALADELSSFGFSKRQTEYAIRHAFRTE